MLLPVFKEHPLITANLYKLQGLLSFRRANFELNDHTIEQFERAGENFEKADAALGIAQCALLCKDPSAKLMRALDIYKSRGN